MNSNTFNFDSHFGVVVRDEIHPVKIWNREFLIIQDEVPNPLDKEMKDHFPCQFFQLSTGWIITRYMSYPQELTYAYYPESSKIPKKLKTRGYIDCVTEFPNGDVLIFAYEKFFDNLNPKRYYVFIYTKSFSVVKKEEMSQTYSCLSLNSTTLITTTECKLNKYTYSELKKIKCVNLPLLSSSIRDFKKITDSLFISFDNHHTVRLLNEDLELLKTFEFNKGESIRHIHILPPLLGQAGMESTRILILSFNGQSLIGLSESFPRFGITIFPIGKVEDGPKIVKVDTEITVYNAVGGGTAQMVYIPEKQEVLVPTKHGIFTTSLKTFKTEKLMDIPAKFVELISVRWPPSKEEFESVVKMVKKLIAIPVDLLREMIEFLKPF